MTYAINRYILPYAEFSYLPGINRQVTGTFSQSGRPYTLAYSVPVRDFHGGVHIRLPIFRESRFVPYLAAGMGGLTNSSRTVSATYTDASGTVQQQLSVVGASEFAINAGGGIRYYMSERFGFRVEAKTYKPTGNFGSVFGKVEGGFFIQLR